jgi:hypothetical protein
MSGIVERLRYWGKSFSLGMEAADEIEKLRAALKDMAKHIWRGDWGKLDPETRALMGEKE